MKQYEQKILNGFANFDIVEKAEATEGHRLFLDDVLLIYATPLTRMDFNGTPDQSKTKLALSLEACLAVGNRLRQVSDLTEEGTMCFLEEVWLSNVPDDKKYALLYGYKLIESVDEEGYVTFNEKLYNAYKSLLNKPREPIEYGDAPFCQEVVSANFRDRLTSIPIVSDPQIRQKLGKWIEQYKARWDVIAEADKYKWEAQTLFQRDFDLDAPDFAEMLERTLPVCNKMFLPYYGRRSVVLENAKATPEVLRKLFANLYDESRSLTDRVTSFKEDFYQIHKSNLKQGKIDGQVHIQYLDDRIISTYLMLRYPEKHYLYKFSVFNNFLKTTQLDFPLAVPGWEENIERYEKVCGYIKRLLLEDEELLALHDKRFGNQYGYNLLVQDFIYAVVTHLGHVS